MSLMAANMHTPRQLISITPWTAIETIAKDNIKDWSVCKARTTSATKPHKSQINGIFHANILGLEIVNALYAPKHGEPTTHTNPNGRPVRSSACPRVISRSALLNITNAKKTAMSPAATTAVLRIMGSHRWVTCLPSLFITVTYFGTPSR